MVFLGINNINLTSNFDEINLNSNFDEDDLDTIIYIRILACHIKFEKHKVLKKELNKKLKPVAWHPERW